MSDVQEHAPLVDGDDDGAGLEELFEKWHLLLALAMFKAGDRTLRITAADLDRFNRVLPDGCIVFLPEGAAVTVRLVTADEGARLRRQHGLVA